MNGEEFKKLVKEDRYQVFLMSSPANLPFSFVIHPWFVVNSNGTTSRFAVGRNSEHSRWEIVFNERKNTDHWGHLHKNWLEPFQGINIFPFTQKFLWKSRLLGYVEGDEVSTAARMAECIEKSSEQYPYCNRYSLRGPNSNTYVQWVLNKFPESNLKLPWNSFGKNYQ